MLFPASKEKTERRECMDNNILFQIIRKALWETKDTVNADNEVFNELAAHAIVALPAPILSTLNLNEELLRNWKDLVMRQVVRNNIYLRAQQTLPISVPYVILKGTAAGQYYPYPELRIMGDIDVMTHYDDFESACQQLLDHGYTEVTSKHDLERKRHREFRKDGFSVEVHLFFASMNDPEKAEIFDQLIVSHIKEDHILPHPINGMVLLEHINQHLEEGLGLRQIIDWMMFVDKELSDDKWPEFQLMAAETGLEKLAVTVTRMCEMELGLKKHEWTSTANERLCRELMSYLLACGNFGQKRSSEEELASGRAAKLRHPVLMIRELQQMGRKSWKNGNHPILKHFAWIWQGYKLARNTSGLVEQINANQRLKKMLDMLEVRRLDKGLVCYENGKYYKEAKR